MAALGLALPTHHRDREQLGDHLDVHIITSRWRRLLFCRHAILLSLTSPIIVHFAV